MRVDYDKIAQEIIRRSGTDAAETARFLSGLYTNRTHFILELLQNAEDSGASQVMFRLYKDRLEFEHDGRSFNEADVLGITGILLGTKRVDLTQIGRFGVGFKSVYAHTLSPEIHSGCIHFVIEDYVRPCPLPPSDTNLGTLFIFPFNHDDRDATESFEEIRKRLERLGMRTLLFLKNIQSVSFRIDAGLSGKYSREVKPLVDDEFSKVVIVHDEKHLENPQQESWLIFNRDVSHLTDDGNSSLAVEIAFRFNNAESNEDPQFIKLTQSELFAFLPTEKETNLGFLVQGPYRTTPARDNIPSDDDFNISLGEETAELVVKALRWLRDREWLTAQVLACMALPHRYRYEGLFESIFDKTMDAIRNEPLIPAYDTGYIAGSHALIAGSETLRSLLDEEQLKQLCGTQRLVRWVTGEITEDRAKDLWWYLRYMIRINELDTDWFVERLTESFISRQTDTWLCDFYAAATEFGRKAKYELKRKPIIRLDDDSHSPPHDANSEPIVFLPSERDSLFPTIKPELCQADTALEFLRYDLGLAEPDIIDEVQHRVLLKYSQDLVSVDDSGHIDDISRLVEASQASSEDDWPTRQRKEELRDQVKNVPILLATNCDDIVEYRRPSEVYIASAELQVYFEDNPDAWFLLDRYESWLRQLEILGVERDIRVSQRNPNRKGYVTISSPKKGSNWDPHKRGLKGFDPDCAVDGLDFSLSHPSVGRSKFIWEKVLLPRLNQISGTVQCSTRQDYVDPWYESQVSKLGELVINSDWLPDGTGNFVRPSELSLDDLPDDLQKDDNLAQMLRMRPSGESLLERGDIPEDVKQMVVVTKGRSPKDVKRALEFFDEERQKQQDSFGQPSVNRRRQPIVPDSPEERSLEDRRIDISEEANTEHSEARGLFTNLNRPGETQLSDTFISPRPLPDTEFRTRRTREELKDAIRNEPDRSERFRQVPRTEWESEDTATREFLYQQYGGRCQICQKTFPKWDGKPYFEAIYLEPRIKARWLDRPGNVLCLCANHAAQFMQGAREFVPDFREQVMSYQNGEKHDLQLTLVGEHKTIGFRQRHIIDLKQILESGASDSS